MNPCSLYDDRYDLATSDAEFVVIASKSRLPNIKQNFETFGLLASEFLIFEDLTPETIRFHLRTSPVLFSVSGTETLLPYNQDILYSQALISDFLGWKYVCSFTPLDFYPPSDWKEILNYVVPNDVTSLLAYGFADDLYAIRSLVDDTSVESLIAFETILALFFRPRVPRKVNNFYVNNAVFPKPGDTIIDCGACANAYGGQFVTEFAKAVLPNGKVIALEPITEVFEALKNDVRDYPNVVLFQSAVWKNRTTLNFISDGISSRHLSLGSGMHTTSNHVSVLADTIDAIAAEQRIDFIKMDVEGSELAALYGAAETIKRDLPDLAICLYHSPNDFLSIPRYIRELSSKYIMHLELNEGNTWAGMKLLATARNTDACS